LKSKVRNKPGNKKTNKILVFKVAVETMACVGEGITEHTYSMTLCIACRCSWSTSQGTFMLPDIYCRHNASTVTKSLFPLISFIMFWYV